MLNENAKMFIVQQVVHWLSTPTHGYLGSNYGIDLYAELQKPLSEFDADGIINKMYADIPILANLPRDFINIHYQHNGIDDVKIFVSIGSGADSVSIDLNFLADKLENSIIDRKMAFMQPKNDDAAEVQAIEEQEEIIPITTDGLILYAPFEKTIEARNSPILNGFNPDNFVNLYKPSAADIKGSVVYGTQDIEYTKLPTLYQSENTGDIVTVFNVGMPTEEFLNRSVVEPEVVKYFSENRDSNPYNFHFHTKLYAYNKYYYSLSRMSNGAIVLHQPIKLRDGNLNTDINKAGMTVYNSIFNFGGFAISNTYPSFRTINNRHAMIYGGHAAFASDGELKIQTSLSHGYNDAIHVYKGRLKMWEVEYIVRKMTLNTKVVQSSIGVTDFLAFDNKGYYKTPNLGYTKATGSKLHNSKRAAQFNRGRGDILVSSLFNSPFGDKELLSKRAFTLSFSFYLDDVSMDLLNNDYMTLFSITESNLYSISDLRNGTSNTPSDNEILSVKLDSKFLSFSQGIYSGRDLKFSVRDIGIKKGWNHVVLRVDAAVKKEIILNTGSGAVTLDFNTYQDIVNYWFISSRYRNRKSHNDFPSASDWFKSMISLLNSSYNYSTGRFIGLSFVETHVRTGVNSGIHMVGRFIAPTSTKFIEESITEEKYAELMNKYYLNFPLRNRVSGEVQPYKLIKGNLTSYVYTDEDALTVLSKYGEVSSVDDLWRIENKAAIMTVGGSKWGIVSYDSPDFFNGMIDDIRMYNRYLSYEEIKPLLGLDRSVNSVGGNTSNSDNATDAYKCDVLSDEIKSILKLVEDSRNKDGGFHGLFLRRIDIRSMSNINPKPEIKGYAYQIDKYQNIHNWKSASMYQGKPLPSGYDSLAGYVFEPIRSDKELKEALEKVLGQSQQEVESILKCIK